MKRSKAGRVMTVILAAGVLAAVVVVVLWRTYTGASYGGDKAEWVYVDSTMTEERLLEMLPRQLGNAGGKAAVLWRLGGGDMSRAAGAYRIDPGMTSLDIYRTISRGRQTTSAVPKLKRSDCRLSKWLRWRPSPKRRLMTVLSVQWWDAFI